MRRIYLKPGFLVITMLFLVQFVYGQDVYENIMSNVRNVEWDNYSDVSSLDESVSGLMSDLQEGGYWSDIDYASTAQSSWRPYNHLGRLNSMAAAYTMEGSVHNGDSALQANIEKALIFWYNDDPRSTNWWYQQIACPQAVGEILILMRAGNKPIAASLENNLLTRMEAIGGSPDASGSQGTGVNKIDIALHWLYRGSLKADKGTVDFAVEQMYLPMILTTGEGLQHDFSYQQHGPQLHIGGYGTVYIDKLSKAAVMTKGTSYTMSEDKLDLLSGFVRDTYIPMVRGSYIHYNVIGRGVAYPGNLSQKGGFLNSLKRMKEIDIANSQEYEDAISRIEGTRFPNYNAYSGNKVFWRSDFVLHSRPEYAMDVRMVSSRTSRNENGNGANLKGYFLSDGANCMVVNGNEYLDIFSVWDWAKVPGVTAPHLSTIPKPAQWGTSGTSVFAGGVSDGSTGVAAYKYWDSYSGINTGASKSWFFLDNEIICLGSDINSTNANQVNTSVNQCLLDGDVHVIDKSGAETVPQGKYSYLDKGVRVFHDSIAYIFPDSANIGLSNITQTGSWYSINTTQSTSIDSIDVFSLWIDHGTQPDNKDYQYIVVPNLGTANDLGTYSLDHIEVLANTDSMAVVREVVGDKWYFVFFDEATYANDDFSIRLSDPCVLILEDIDAADVNVKIASASQFYDEISIVGNFPALSETKELVCTFPVYPEPYAGETMEYMINELTPKYVPSSEKYIVFTAVDDSYCRDGSYANNNYGGDTFLTVKMDNAGYMREAFVKFDLSELDTSQIEGISLEMDVMSAAERISESDWVISYCADDSWDETSLTWNNRPAVFSEIATVDTKVTGQTLELDITDFVLNEALAHDKMLTLKFTATERAGGKAFASFYSKENGDTTLAPRLMALKKVQEEPNAVIMPGEAPAAWKINIQVFDIGGRLLVSTTRDKLRELNLRQGMYIIVESYLQNGRVHKRSYKYIERGEAYRNTNSSL